GSRAVRHIPSSFSPCGRRWREAPDEGRLSMRDGAREDRYPSPSSPLCGDPLSLTTRERGTHHLFGEGHPTHAYVRACASLQACPPPLGSSPRARSARRVPL